jgi:hypothetical protein
MKSILAPAAAAAAVHAFLLAAFVACHQGDPAALVCVGNERAGKEPYEVIHISFERFGYDGQFYYALARAPWTRHLVGIDFAPGRQMRILYPALAWVASGGDAHLLLWVMPIINILAIGALAAVGALFARRHGLSPWWGFFLPLAVNAGFPALRDLTDVLSILTVAGVVVAWMLRWPVWQLALWAAAAVLCREQNIAIIGAILLVAAWERRWSACAVLGGALVLWVAWVIALRLMYGTWPFLPTQRNFDRPFAAFFRCWRHLKHQQLSANTLTHFACMVMVAAQVCLALYLAVRRTDAVLRLVLLGAVALAVTAGPAIYEDKWSFIRVLAWLPLAVWLGCIREQRRSLAALLALAAFLPLGVVLRSVFVGDLG